MNKLMRIVLYITAGCAGIGCAALILGLVLGGHQQKSGDAGVSSVWSRLENSVRSAVSQLEQRTSHGHSHDEAVTQVQDYIYGEDAAEGIAESTETGEGTGTLRTLRVSGADQVKQLDIDLCCGGLEIYEWDSDQFYVEMSEEAEDISAVCRDGRIEIRDNREDSGWNEDIWVSMAVPADAVFKQIDIQMDAGWMDTECALKADHMTLDAKAGEIYIGEKLEVEDFSASVDTGVIEIEQGVFGNIDLECGLGSIDLAEVSSRKDARISCGMGTVELGLAGDTDSVNYVLACGMGSIEIGDETYSALAHEKRVDNGASATFTLECGMGTIDIQH